MELEEKCRRHARRIIEAIKVEMMKRLKVKEEEMAKIKKIELGSGRKGKVLAQVKDNYQLNDDDYTSVVPARVEALMDDAQSCYRSNGNRGHNDLQEEGNEDKDMECWHRLAGKGVKDKEEEKGKTRRNDINISRLCKMCGKEESYVLIFPYRHLCLCIVCGSSLHTCTICKSFKTASVHVNMS